MKLHTIVWLATGFATIGSVYAAEPAPPPQNAPVDADAASINAQQTLCNKFTGITRDDCLRGLNRPDTRTPDIPENPSPQNQPGTLDSLPSTHSTSDFGSSAPQGIDSFSSDSPPEAGSSDSSGSPGS